MDISADMDPALDSNELVTQPESHPLSAQNVGSLPDDVNVITIHEGGDMHFVVISKNGTSSKTWLVSSSCVRLASPVWASTIETLSADQSGKLRLEVVDNSDNIIEIALRAAHLQHLTIPLHLSFGELVDVAEVCEHHDVARLLEPYLKSWASRWSANVLAPGYGLWIFVAYHFGYFDIFETLSEHLAESMRMGEGGDWFYGDLNLTASKVKGVILDNLIRIREEHIKSIVEECSLLVRIYSGERNVCPFDDEANSCTTLYLGAIVRLFQHCRLWPSDADADVHRDSVNEIRERLCGAEVTDYHSRKFRAIECRSRYCIELFAGIFAGRNKVVLTVEGSEIDKHFENVYKNRRVAPLLCWEYAAKMRMGFMEGDFDIIRRHGEHSADYRVNRREGGRETVIAQDSDPDVVMQEENSDAFTPSEVETSDEEEVISHDSGDWWTPDNSDFDSDYETEEDPSEPEEEFEEDESDSDSEDGS